MVILSFDPPSPLFVPKALPCSKGGCVQWQLDRSCHTHAVVGRFIEFILDNCTTAVDISKA